MKAYRAKKITGRTIWPYGHKNPLLRWYFYKRLDAALTQSGICESDVTLDVGAGLGVFTFSLASRSQKVYACDISATIKIAKESLIAELGEGTTGKVALFFATGAHLPLKDESVDVVFLLDCLEHMLYPDNELTIHEAKRVLKSRGTLVCSLPNECGITLLLRSIGVKLTKFQAPHYPLKKLLKACIHNKPAVSEHIKDHIGYDYHKDLSIIKDLFGNVSRSFVPLPFLFGLAPTIVVKAKKQQNGVSRKYKEN